MFAIATAQARSTRSNQAAHYTLHMRNETLMSATLSKYVYAQ